MSPTLAKNKCVTCFAAGNVTRKEIAYEEFAAIEFNRTEVILGAQAHAYVWAVQDVTGQGAANTGWSGEFSMAYMVYAYEIRTGKYSGRHTIQAAFIAYSLTGDIATLHR